MKLPADRRERIKLYVVMALGAALVLLGLVQGIVQPVRRSRRAKLERLQQCTEELRAAQAEIAREPRDRLRHREAMARIRDVSDRFILHPVLGNYALRAGDIVEREAARVDLTLDDVREIGLVDVPRAHPRESQRYLSAYAARLTLTCGYNELVRFLQVLEEANPYLCIVAISITGDPAVDPERHRVSLDLQWPVWAEERPADLLHEEKETVKPGETS